MAVSQSDVIIATGIFLVITCGLPTCNSDHDSKKSDGVYESAMKNLDRGLPLNEREQKRIDDILSAGDKRRSEEIEKKYGER